jgi:short-subunit dehydrogenase
MHTLITGASSGIGEALARELHQAGHTVTLVARRKAKLDELVTSLGERAHALAADLSDSTCVAAVLREAEARGPIDILINNAGVENTAPILETDPAGCEALLRSNLITPLLLTRSVLPGMIERKRGAVVQVASVAAIAALPGQTWYGASKAGLAQFSETLRSELAGTGVHLVVVYPGPVKTPMSDAAYERYGGRGGTASLAPEGTADELARLVRRAIERREPRVIYPGFYKTAWWFPRLARFLNDKIAPRPLSAAQLAAKAKQ